MYQTTIGKNITKVTLYCKDVYTMCKKSGLLQQTYDSSARSNYQTRSDFLDPIGCHGWDAIP